MSLKIPHTVKLAGNGMRLGLNISVNPQNLRRVKRDAMHNLLVFSVLVFLALLSSALLDNWRWRGWEFNRHICHFLHMVCVLSPLVHTIRTLFCNPTKIRIWARIPVAILVVALASKIIASWLIELQEHLIL